MNTEEQLMDEEQQLRQAVIDAALKHFEVKHKRKMEKEFQAGDRIPYAGRVFDEKEITNLIDASLDFWLVIWVYGMHL
jgi:CDP-6-deoxy-D-xylo-4-hexulose-3-dehydrase